MGLYLNIIYSKKIAFILASINKNLIQKESVYQRFSAMNFLIATESSIFMCAGYNNTSVYFFKSKGALSVWGFLGHVRWNRL